MQSLFTAEFAMAQPPQTPTATPAVNQTPSRPGSTTTPGSGSGATGSASAGKLKMVRSEDFSLYNWQFFYQPI